MSDVGISVVVALQNIDGGLLYPTNIHAVIMNTKKNVSDVPVRIIRLVFAFSSARNKNDEVRVGNSLLAGLSSFPVPKWGKYKTVNN